MSFCHRFSSAGRALKLLYSTIVYIFPLHLLDSPGTSGGRLMLVLQEEKGPLQSFLARAVRLYFRRTFCCGILSSNLTTVLTTTGNRRAETGRERCPKRPEKGAKRGERSLKSDHRIFGTKRPWVRTPPLRPKKSVESCRFNALFGCYGVLGGKFDPNLTTIGCNFGGGSNQGWWPCKREFTVIL